MSTLLTASIFLLALWPAYAALLKYSDRYALNRFLLVAVMVAVCALPFVSWESPAPVITQRLQGSVAYVERATFQLPEFVPVLENEAGEMSASAYPMENRVPLSEAIANAPKTPVAYLGGVGLMLLLLGGRLLFLLASHLRSRPNGRAGYRLLAAGASSGQAFTFGTNIYFSEDVPEDPDFDHILTHERVHARQLHTVDIMLTEVFLCLFWFHPVAWWLRTKMRANLEYLVDKAVVNQGADRRNYQLALVRQSVVAQGLALALPFSEPSLKSRIERMTGLPKYRVIGILAAIALTSWMGLAGLLVSGNADDTTPQALLPGDVTVPNLGELVAANTQPDVAGIESFKLYFRRLPTPYEFAQIQEILGVLDHTSLSIYHPCDAEEGQYSLQLSHWLNVEARLFSSLREGELLDDHSVFKLEPNGVFNLVPATPHVTSGYFRPVFAETVWDMEGGTVTFTVEGETIELKQWLAMHPEKTVVDGKMHLIDYRNDIADEEIAVFVNGERRLLNSRATVSISGSHIEADKVDVRFNGLPVPTWSKSNFASWSEVEAENGMPPVPANVRMNCLLGMSKNQFSITRNIRSSHSGSSRAWFELMKLPEDREIIYYLNDEVSTATEVLDRDFTLVDVQVGYNCDDPNGLVIVQAIDDVY